MNFFNPKVKEFLDAKPDITLIGLAWSLYWRLMVIVLVIEVAIAILFILFTILGIFTSSIFGR